jgi:D-beta-D-heptose 7-phosphate kinase/D-beta-D-heptose 1-phosphate adenosyltransferase
VDFVLDFSEDTPLEIIKSVSPDVLVKGGDWPDPIGSDLVSQVFSFEQVGGHSTSGIVAKIRSVEST